MESKYSEHEKLKAIQDKSQAIGEFLEWLPSSKRKIHLAVYPRDEDEESEIPEYCLLPAQVRIEELLAEFFGINEKKLEQEKMKMLQEIRAKP